MTTATTAQELKKDFELLQERTQLVCDEYQDDMDKADDDMDAQITPEYELTRPEGDRGLVTPEYLQQVHAAHEKRFAADEKLKLEYDEHFKKLSANS